MTILICGLGSIGKRHLRLLRNAGVQKIIALRSGNSKTGTDLIADIEINDLKELDGLNIKIDGAIISNPTSLHIMTAIKLAQRCIPMLIEKPLDKNLNNAEELTKIVNENSIPVLIGYNLLYHPGISGMKELIKEGKTGKVISARTQFGTFMPGWHKDEDYKKSYAANSSMGGGVDMTYIHEQNKLKEKID